ncbi:FUSC family protein [uncultured Roseibium sp.]|uniref:FUSC family protein n=1 Tax=uncultured Roseibium sp. TaxID=1936171 RepID=UPI0026270FA4|nr:FUSC family protein [uncultured Roseibium sp.]
MLQQFPRVISRIQRYDPGALRLVRGIHLTVAVLLAAVLADHLAAFLHSVPGFALAVVCAAAAAHVLLFTPISTRKRELGELVRFGAVLTLLTGIGAFIGTQAGASAPIVLQTIWIAVIALGFGLDGLGPFWLRTGRMISIFWLFVIMSSTPHSLGIWLPVMTFLGVSIAVCVRIGLWRPSASRTIQRVEAANRKALAEYLDLSARGCMRSEKESRAALHDLAGLRAELELAVALAGEESNVRALSPEAAAMIRLALEVVRNAVEALPEVARNTLIADRNYLDALENLVGLVRTGEAEGAVKPPDLTWARKEGQLRKQDVFQVLRIAQAFNRMRQLADGDAPIELAKHPSSPSEGRSGAWHRVSWRLALQASVAASAGYGIGHYLHLSHAYWITLTVIVVLCSSLGATIQKTLQRTLGTVVGFVVALLLEPVLSQLPEFRLILIVALLPPVIILFERNYGIAVGFISFLVLIGLEALTGLPVSEFWARLYDTMIGAGAGLAAAWLLFPKRSGAGARGLAGAYLTSCRNHLADDRYEADADQRTYSDLKKDARNLINAAQNYRAEQVPWASSARTGGDLDVLVVVLADYVILYRQARSAVRREVAGRPGQAAVEELLVRMDRRVLDEFDAALEHKAHAPAPGLAEEWLAAMPSPDTTDIGVMTDWVATLYYARKVVRCLEGLQQEHIWSAPSDLAGETAHG